MTETASTAPDAGLALRVDLVSDVVCPWCYIGLRAFVLASGQRPDVPIQLTLRAYQLDPDVPQAGVDRQARLLEKFGGDRERLRMAAAAVEETGRTVGIQFAFDRIATMPNTRDCHRLLRWAQGAGQGLRMAETLFRAYFCDGADLTQRQTLVDLAAEAGLEADVVAGLLASDADIAAVDSELGIARRIGITGVPCFIFDGDLAVMGAQTPEAFARAIDTAWTRRTSPDTGVLQA